MNVLAIDAGNTRVKWGLHDGARWLVQSAVETARAAELAAAWADLPPPQAVIVSNVAGAALRKALAKPLATFDAVPHWITSVREQCGVTNSYDDPAQLGCDRWAALIGAWRLVAGASVVVSAGTALTVDALSGAGVFIGGLIVPGAELMRTALATHTAGLGLARGRFTAFPKNTADAILSGAVDALCGAVERLARRLGGKDGQANLTCVLSGGAARMIAPHLNLPLKLVDNLVLEGLLAIASEEKST